MLRNAMELTERFELDLMRSATLYSLLNDAIWRTLSVPTN